MIHPPRHGINMRLEILKLQRAETSVMLNLPFFPFQSVSFLPFFFLHFFSSTDGTSGGHSNDFKFKWQHQIHLQRHKEKVSWAQLSKISWGCQNLDPPRTCGKVESILQTHINQCREKEGSEVRRSWLVIFFALYLPLFYKFLRMPKKIPCACAQGYHYSKTEKTKCRRINGFLFS